MPGRQYDSADEMPYANSRFATPEFFETLRIRIREGRVFEEQDRLRSTRLLVINETMARNFWPRERVVGKQLILQERRDEVLAEVIGVVDDWRSIRSEGSRLTSSPGIK